MKSILGLDIGYGDVKVVYIDQSNEIKNVFKFPSAIGITERNEFVTDSRILSYADPDGNMSYYYVGEDAIRLPSENLIDITEYANLEFYAPLFLYRVIQIIKETPDIVIAGLSKSQIENSGHFKQKLQKFVINDKEFNFPNLSILPQGAGSKLTIDKYGKNFPHPQTEFQGNATYVGVDIGFNTLDLFLVTDGKTSPNLVQGVEHEGVMKIARAVGRFIKDKFGRQISLQEAKDILDTKVYKLRGERHDLSEEIHNIKKDYIKGLIKLIDEKFDKVIDKSDFIFLNGGGSVFFNTTKNGFIRVPESNHEFYNAIGFALWGQSHREKFE